MAVAGLTTLTAINEFVEGCVTDSIWDKITEAYLLAGVTWDGLMVKLKGTGTLTNNNFVTGDYQTVSEGAGLVGNGSSKYLDTGLLDTTLSADDKSFGAYQTGAATVVYKPLIAIRTASAYWGIITSSPVTTIDFNIPLADASIGAAATNTTGMLTASRRAVNDTEAYKNGSSVGTDTTTATATNAAANWELFGRGSAFPNYSDARMTFGFIGTGLTDTESLNLSKRVNMLMYRLGCEVYLDQPIIDDMALDSEVDTYAAAVLSAGGNW